MSCRKNVWSGKKHNCRSCRGYNLRQAYGLSTPDISNFLNIGTLVMTHSFGLKNTRYLESQVPWLILLFVTLTDGLICSYLFMAFPIHYILQTQIGLKLESEVALVGK